MHVSAQTLRTMVDLSGIALDKLAQQLTLAGLEVESVRNFEDDTVFELKITPNRPDALSHMGIARELAAISQVRTTFQVPTVKELGASIHDLVQVNLNTKEACPRYACRVIEGVRIEPSPEWLQKKLLSFGLRPINNVVDITNWVLFERGQPLHAFDLDLMTRSNSRVAIRVRYAQEGETLKLIDGKERILKPSDLVIAEENRALALAGVMGGQETEVSHTTQNILLESAYFEPKGIRKTAKRLGISTDSSYRFERGTDPNGVMTALDRAVSMIQEIAGGRIRRGAMDIYPKAIEPLEIPLRPKRLQAISGLSEIDLPDLRTRLLSLGIETAGRLGHDSLYFRIPTYRPDIKEEIDLIEEAVRLIGFEKVPTKLSCVKGDFEQTAGGKIDRLERRIKLFLSQAGFHEAINYAFGSPDAQKSFDSSPSIILENPLGVEYSAMRKSLFPGLLKNLELNLNQQIPKPNIFETGIVFLAKNPEGKKPSQESLTAQNMAMDSYASEKNLCAGLMHQGDFFDLKGIWEQLFEILHLKVEFKPLSDQAYSFLHPKQAAQIWHDEICLGALGYLHPDFQENSKNCVFEIDLQALMPLCLKTVQVKSLPKFPGIQRDLALVLDEITPVGDILNLINNFEPLRSILERASIFDVYQGKGVESGKKSVAVSVYLRDPERTLKEESIAGPIQGLMTMLEKSLGATLRTA